MIPATVALYASLLGLVVNAGAFIVLTALGMPFARTTPSFWDANIVARAIAIYAAMWFVYTQGAK